MKIISWFSAGITSTIATKLAIEKYEIENVEIIFFETGAHHPDNERYIKECEERLFKKKVRIEKSHKWKDLWDVLNHGYINSPSGAYCTHQLKKEVRNRIEKNEQYDQQIFGFEYDNKNIKRAERFVEQYPKAKAEFPLIDNKLTKLDCLRILKNYNIELPQMYKLGYSNNNCLGCVKGGQGYWNKIRKDFPEIFEKMAKLERKVGATCLLETKNGKRVKLYLDTLDPNRGRKEKPITEECGIYCPIEEFEDIE